MSGFMFLTVETENDREIESMTKKGHRKFWASKMDIRKFGPRNLCRPPNSAPSLRPILEDLIVTLDIGPTYLLQVKVFYIYACIHAVISYHNAYIHTYIHTYIHDTYMIHA